jgi:hypothetical protein
MLKPSLVYDAESAAPCKDLMHNQRRTQMHDEGGLQKQSMQNILFFNAQIT